MGRFWDEVKDLRMVIKQERIGGRQLVDIQEWDCFDELVIEWMQYFKTTGKNAKDRDLRHGGSIFDSAMNLDHSTPPAKRSGGNATVRAYELWRNYGPGGPSFGAAMAEGRALAAGRKTSYPTRSRPKGSLGK
jgi:hypothetical protein